jgi:hypothetical protein
MTIANSDEVLSDAELAKLTLRLDVYGEVRTAAHLRLSRTSVLRLLSRRPVHLGTISLARIGLAKAF